MHDIYQPLDGEWTVRALNPESAPCALRRNLSQGIPATVPGEVTIDLLHAGLIDDPLDADHESEQLWIGETDWLFERSFSWQDDGHSMHELVAKGLDTIATIALNGRIVASTKNCYRSYRWDIRDYLRPGDNTITVTFTSPIRESERLEHRRGFYPHAERWPFNHIRKTPYSFGWDWGIAAPNAGICRSMGIESWSTARIGAVRPLTSVDPEGNGSLDLYVDIARAHTGHVTSMTDPYSDEGDLELTATVHGNGADVSLTQTVAPGSTQGHMHLNVDQVRCWWPVGYGDPTLYDLDISLQPLGSREQIGTWSKRIGFRTITADTATDETGHPFRIIVNGQPIHARGYNWIPDSVFISQVTRHNYERGIKDLVESNSNMIRVWGGGVYESDEFYDLADERGVLVWQDFAFACAMYPEDCDMVDEVDNEARENIVRLSRHPSLAIWNGSNENWTAYANWRGYQYGLKDDKSEKNRFGYAERGWGDLYYSDLLPSLLKELDPDRPYLPSSPMSFSHYADPSKDTDGTMHIWDVWNSADYRTYAEYKPRFADEFGYQAPPSWSLLTQSVHDSPMTPFSPQMLAHQKAMLGNEKIARGMRSHLTPGSFMDCSTDAQGRTSWLIPSDHWQSTEDWHWAAQLQQAQAVRFGIEHMRSLEPVNCGILVWQLNDDWPSTSWSAVDYAGHRKPLWYSSRQAFAPHFATIVPGSSAAALSAAWPDSRPTRDRLELAVVNDAAQDWSGEWFFARRRFDGTILAQGVCPVDVPAHSSVRIPLPQAVSSIADPTAEIITADTSEGYQRVVFDAAEVMDQRLVRRPLHGTVLAADDGYDLVVTASSYARDIFCMADKVQSDACVDEGMISLLPHESAHLRVHCGHVDDPETFLAPNVLRCANDIGASARE
ncbi:MAG: glycoside hydrolase family 2 protein [Bifidobacterium sp.]|jgi:beta-mannosidase